MSQKGKRRRLSKEENKEDENAQIHKNPTMPSSAFKNEVVLNAGEPTKKATLGYFREIKPDEPLPEGTTGCFVAEEGLTLRDQISDMKSEMTAMKSRINSLESEVDDLNTQLSPFVGSHFGQFRNLVVQLGNSLLESALIMFLEAHELKLFDNAPLNFDAVLNCVHLSDARKAELKADPLYKEVANLTTDNTKFKRIKYERNLSVHPEQIKTDHLQKLSDQINVKYLEPDQKRSFYETQCLFYDILDFGKLQALLKIFNDRNK